MFYWSCEATATTTATPEQIWNLWTNLDSWPQWDTDVAWAKLETSFVQGAYFRMKPTNGPAMRCLLQEVTHLHSFSTLSRLPLTKVSFTHVFSEGTLCHKVEMRGWLTPLFKQLFGYKIEKELSSVVRSLAVLAEGS
ncbi:SRPBCC family protein [Desulfovibrio cuneatus]|uniref:SRPBCC family protein n=1 Tax=Desulfovibrio cuneatus TaxID=159728 RepID=UPI0004829FD5|nr:hypothetical protein [Desulfovibrio cuneatus]